MTPLQIAIAFAALCLLAGMGIPVTYVLALALYDAWRVAVLRLKLWWQR